MSHVVSFALSLVGSLLATWSLAAGGSHHQDDPETRRRIPLLLTLALLFLGAALVGRAVELLSVRASVAPLDWIELALLMAGAGATLWAFLGSKSDRIASTFGTNLSRRGRLALALLGADLVVDVARGRVTEAVQQLPGPAGGLAFLVGIPTLLALVLGTGAATLAFRSSSPLVAEPGSLRRRLNAPTRGMLALLALALAGVVLAARIAPESELFLCLMLLTMGIATGLVALFYQARAPLQEQPAPWGISARGWVSLALLAAAVVTLGVQQMRYLDHSAYVASRPSKSEATKAVPEEITAEAPSTWSMRLLPRPEPTAQEKEAEQKRWTRVIPVAPARTEKAEPAAAPDPAASVSRLNQTIGDLDRRLASLEAANKVPKADNKPPVSAAPHPPGSDPAHAAGAAPSGETVSPASLGLLLERLDQLNHRMAALESKAPKPTVPAAPPIHTEKPPSGSGSP
jgi:hypothetical protein